MLLIKFHCIKDRDHRGKGSYDGVFQRLPYFTCKHDCGLFVSLDRLRFEPAGFQDELQSQQYVDKQPQQSYAAASSGNILKERRKIEEIEACGKQNIEDYCNKKT